MLVLVLYTLLFILSYLLYSFLRKKFNANNNSKAIKTVTFGDESAVKPNRFASGLSILTLFFLWGAFTGSDYVPLHVPGPFIGETEFSYTASNEQSETDSAQVHIHVFSENDDSPHSKLITEAPDGFAQDDSITVKAWRSKLIRVQKNDQGGKDKSYKIIKVNNQTISSLQAVKVDNGLVTMSSKGSLTFTPYKGWQMEAIWLPSPEAVINRFFDIAKNGYQNISLAENIGWSLYRVLMGFLLGSLIGIPLGYAMGLSGWVRGWFDPIVEFMRPIPPLALIPLVIIWFGIWETGKISLLFLAALWIMTLAARAGVSGVNIIKVHAAYSLGASKLQILRHVIMPNSLPDIFTGARVAMGVCWGTVVAAELVAAEKGAGKMIIAASKFQQTDIVIMGIILIGLIGYSIDIFMRKLEQRLVPWKGKS